MNSRNNKANATTPNSSTDKNLAKIMYVTSANPRSTNLTPIVHTEELNAEFLLPFIQ